MHTQLFKPIGPGQLMSYSTEKQVQGTQNKECKIFIYITDTWGKRTREMNPP